MGYNALFLGRVPLQGWCFFAYACLAQTERCLRAVHHANGFFLIRYLCAGMCVFSFSPVTSPSSCLFRCVAGGYAHTKASSHHGHQRQRFRGQAAEGNGCFTARCCIKVSQRNSNKIWQLGELMLSEKAISSPTITNHSPSSLL